MDSLWGRKIASSSVAPLLILMPASIGVNSRQLGTGYYYFFFFFLFFIIIIMQCNYSASFLDQTVS